MNQQEARALAEVRRQLERGPGTGWTEAITGRPPGAALTIAEQRRREDLALWLQTWILPPIDHLLVRYGRRRPRRGRRRARS